MFSRCAVRPDSLESAECSIESDSKETLRKMILVERKLAI
jgi:hypothetical protein